MGASTFLNLFQNLNSVVHSVVSDMSVDNEMPVMNSSISRVCRLSLSKMLIGLGLRVWIYKVSVHACICERLRLYAVLQNKEVHKNTDNN